MKKILTLITIGLCFVFHTETFASAETNLGTSLFIVDPIKTIENKKTEEPSTQAKKPKKVILKAVPVETNYDVMASGTAISLYKHKSSDTYIQKINLGSGVTIRSLSEQQDWDSESGEPIFLKKTLKEHANLSETSVFSVINGQFFDPTRSVTPLSFGLKEGGIVRTAGADNRSEKKNILIITDNSAKIVPYSWDNLDQSEGYLAIVGLSGTQPQTSDKEIGRTILCLAHPSASGASDTLITMSALSISESWATKELKRWGCETTHTIKLDSSGSSQIWTPKTGTLYGKNTKGTEDYRKIPHALGFLVS